MATVYTASKYNQWDHLYYRVRCDYSTTNNPTNMVISATFRLQYKGTYKKPSGTVTFEGGEGSGTLGNVDFTLSRQKPTASKSDWTNVGSAVTKTVTKTKEEYQQSIDCSFSVATEPMESASKTVAITIPALTSYAVKYSGSVSDATGVPSEQKKYYGRTLTLSSSKPSRSGYAFSHWNTHWENTGTRYNSGASYTANDALQLYAIWNPIIYYNGNGAAISVSSQEKAYGTNLTLRSTVPTRMGYVFDSWNTKTDGSGTKYLPGGTYTSNSTATLYAQWKKLPDNPKITSMTAIRCDSTGNQDDEGNYAKITVGWSVDTTSPVYPNNTGTVTGTIRAQNESTGTAFTFSTGSTGTSGTAEAIIADVSTDEQYYVTAKVTDQNSATSKTVILTRAFFIMDFKAGGKSVGLGRAAPEDECLEIGYKTVFDEDVTLLKNLACGVVNVGTVADKSYVDHTVTFVNPFEKLPVILLTITSGSADTTTANVSAVVQSRTKNEFVIRTHNRSGSSKSVQVYWMATTSGLQ